MTSEQTVRERANPQSSRAATGDLVVARVVIAEDDPETLEMLCEILRSPTVEICKAASGTGLVFLLAEQGPFDLIVTDIDMPYTEGVAVIRSARAAEIETPVLFISGISRPDLPAAIERLGSSRLLRKPIEVSTLRRTVKQMLGALS
jgi:two-component system, cell cycle response regulator CtrA